MIKCQICGKKHFYNSQVYDNADNTHCRGSIIIPMPGLQFDWFAFSSFSSILVIFNLVKLVTSRTATLMVVFHLQYQKPGPTLNVLMTLQSYFCQFSNQHNSRVINQDNKLLIRSANEALDIILFKLYSNRRSLELEATALPTAP